MALSKESVRSRFCSDSDRYYRVKLFDDLGFIRRQCPECKKFFWTLNQEQTRCPDPPCTPYGFIGEPVGRFKGDYIELWREIEKFFVKNGHASIRSYPTVCRWFPGLYFTIASIVAFQRSVAGLPVFEFPRNPLIIPQVCLRFNDIPNVGVTGRHNTCFIMIGQHSMHDEKTGKGYWKDRCIELDWNLLVKIFGIKPEEISFVEDVWIGPSAFGYSLEYFTRGLELGNAVFTEFLGTPENFTIMDKKIIDMGAGHERFLWALSGSATTYDSAFGTVIEDLKKRIEYDNELFIKYSKMAGGLNIENVHDVSSAKAEISKRLGVPLDKLRKTTEKLEAIYAIADHSKALLYAITDGQLPSNVGGGYNLRLILRRALSFIEKFGFDINLYEVCEAHAEYLKKLEPRLVENLDDVKKIIDIETKRWKESRQRSVRIIRDMLNDNEKFNKEKMSELYESHGITPELITEVARINKKTVHLPPDFYIRVTEKHIAEIPEAERKIDVSGLPKTVLLFYQHPKIQKFEGKVLKIIDHKYVVLDKTAFYGRAGGQEPDNGMLGGCRVYDVDKIGDVIVHAVDGINFKEGDIIEGKIDWQRREQLMKHHTATHIINGACRKVLGNHIWQHSAFKGIDKARLDVTHYAALTDEQMENIEKIANEIVKSSIDVRFYEIPRMDAESKFGFRIYQGGAVPGSMLRIIEIPDFDVEACGGTHVRNTVDVGKIILLGSERIQDGVVRLTFAAGPAADIENKKISEIIEKCCEIMGTGRDNLLAETEKLISKWKNMQKRNEKIKEKHAEELASYMEKRIVNNVLIESIDGGMEILQSISKRLSSQKRLLILFGIGERISVWVAAGEKTGVDAGAIAKEICARLGGKGGGTSSLGRGSGKEKKEIEKIKEELRERYG